MKLADIWRSKFLATSTEAIGGGLCGMLRKQPKGQCDLSMKRGEYTELLGKEHW